MKLSVIVPVYNVEKYIHECVDSLVNQTFKDMELILVDDGSRDNCPSICDEYARLRSNVKVVHKRNGGSNSARKAGIQVAQGEYIAFVDADDWVDLNYYEKIFGEISDYSPEMIRVPQFHETAPSIGSVFRAFAKTGYFSRVRLEKEIYPILLYNPPFYGNGILPAIWSVIFKKNLFLNYLLAVPDEIRTGEDLAFTVTATLNAHDVFIVGTAGYYYRQNPASITHTYQSAEIHKIVVLLNFLSNAIKPESPFGLHYQLTMYAVYVAYRQGVSMLLHSQNLKEDVWRASELVNHPLVKDGLKNKLPLKQKIILKSIKNRQILLLKALKIAGKLRGYR